ncbi:MAG TPA: GNAT family N-acetyltransferase [Chitinophaga sp.]|uniref:GNAT family N-acetyltransferase n=1 Tax=Chitinophaga sp. TaxID=1869181 RepID=UPI002F951AFA
MRQQSYKVSGIFAGSPADNMIIRKLKQIDKNEFDGLGRNGYTSEKMYAVDARPINDDATFHISLQQLPAPFVKNWKTTAGEITALNHIIATGHSFGAYENEQLVGMAVCEERTWNNTLYIENILVAEKYRGQKVGTQLIEALISHARVKQLRLIELETQNTNAPAIAFYRQQGFAITGLNMKLYNQENSEIAIFMTYQL